MARPRGTYINAPVNGGNDFPRHGIWLLAQCAGPGQSRRKRGYGVAECSGAPAPGTARDASDDSYFDISLIVSATIWYACSYASAI